MASKRGLESILGTEPSGGDPKRMLQGFADKMRQKLQSKKAPTKAKPSPSGKNRDRPRLVPKSKLDEGDYSGMASDISPHKLLSDFAKALTIKTGPDRQKRINYDPKTVRPRYVKMRNFDLGGNKGLDDASVQDMVSQLVQQTLQREPKSQRQIAKPPSTKHGEGQLEEANPTKRKKELNKKVHSSSSSRELEKDLKKVKSDKNKR